MSRHTVKQADGSYTAADPAKAIEQLGRLEDLCDLLAQEHAELSSQLEKMRYDNKTHSVRFKELVVKKLNNANVLSLLKVHGLFDAEAQA